MKFNCEIKMNWFLRLNEEKIFTVEWISKKKICPLLKEKKSLVLAKFSFQKNFKVWLNCWQMKNNS